MLRRAGAVNVFLYNSDIKEMIENFKSFFEMLLNPKELMIMIWDKLFQHSYTICLLLILVGVLIYIMGGKENKLGGKMIRGSFILYLIMCILNLVIG